MSVDALLEQVAKLTDEERAEFRAGRRKLIDEDTRLTCAQKSALDRRLTDHQAD